MDFFFSVVPDLALFEIPNMILVLLVLKRLEQARKGGMGALLLPGLQDRVVRIWFGPGLHCSQQPVCVSF